MKTLYILFLKQPPNVILYGSVPLEILAKKLRRVVAFLISYDAAKNHSKAIINYHKLMEYLAYGRPIVSNYISRYTKEKEIFIMPESGNNRFNKEFVTYLLKILNNWDSCHTRVENYTVLTKVILS